MKVDHSKIKKYLTQLPSECKQIIQRLQQCSRAELLDELCKIHTWNFGKSELYHWAPVLDIFDEILEEAAQTREGNKWALHCDYAYKPEDRNLLLWILHFSTLLIEHSFSRHLYNSMDHLLNLLFAKDMAIVLGVLNLLYMFSKRSNYIVRMKPEDKAMLRERLYNMAGSWGGKENSFGLADCCDENKPVASSAGTLHVEFHRKDSQSGASSTSTKPQDKQNVPQYQIIHVENIDKLNRSPADIMKSLLGLYNIPKDQETWVYYHVRLACLFNDYKSRLLLVQARLQAISILIYSNTVQDCPSSIIYHGLLEELVELVELSRPHLVDIRSAAMRTLTAIIHFDRNPQLNKKTSGSRLHNIIDVTGANQYHGFLPVMVRTCIAMLTNQDNEEVMDKAENIFPRNVVTDDDKPVDFHCDEIMSIGMLHNGRSKFPLPLATALFSFLYHLASYEAGGEALVACGMMESLLEVISWSDVDLEHITFVTRAVRVVDLITNIDMHSFQLHDGLSIFLDRLHQEIIECKPDLPCEAYTKPLDPDDDPDVRRSAKDAFEIRLFAANTGNTCLPQRAALLKSILNFLKKAFQDGIFAEKLRLLPEGTMPESLKAIIINVDYFGPSLFLLAADVVTVFIYQEPTLLSALQKCYVTDTIMHALLRRDIPATREVIGSVPNIFSALCLNEEGYKAFTHGNPFSKIFGVLISPTYLPTMRRRRSSEPASDTATNLGNAMDELMRHQPGLRQGAIKALISLIRELVEYGSDPRYICWRTNNKNEVSPNSVRLATNTDAASSDEEEEDEEDTSTSSQNPEQSEQAFSERVPVALVDYTINVMKFTDAILSNNSTDDHCKEFVAQDGLPHLMRVLGMPNLPVDYVSNAPAQVVSTVCKSILNLAHEPQIFKHGLRQLKEILENLKPLFYEPGSECKGPKLLLELASASNIETAFTDQKATPLLHKMMSVHGYIIMFVHICRTGQSDIRNIAIKHWGTQDGIMVLKGLSELYLSLVWESALLLSYGKQLDNCTFRETEMAILRNFFQEIQYENTEEQSTSRPSTSNITTNPFNMDVEEPNVKYLKPLLNSASRLGRALAELFGLLVKLSVGPPLRARRGPNIVPQPAAPNPYCRNIATALATLLKDGLDWERLPDCPRSKCTLTFLSCHVGFTSPMLFDEKRYPYHLMLKKFVAVGGLNAFFSAYNWALTFQGPTISPSDKEMPTGLLPGTYTFLKSWLILLEKLVNPKAVLESPHIISSSFDDPPITGWHFDPLRYLIRIHKQAFKYLQFMWGKVNIEASLTESLFTVLKHILKGEKIIDKKIADGKLDFVEEVTTRENILHLMDMGFSRRHALEALLNSISLEQATEYLLTHRPTEDTALLDLSLEHEPIMQSIALSMCSPNRDPEEEVPLEKSVIENFTKKCPEICIEYIREVPECIHKACELLIIIMKRNGTKFRDDLINDMINTMYQNAMNLIQMSLEEFVEKASEDGQKLSTLVHMYILFMEMPRQYHIRLAFVKAVYKQVNFIPYFVELVWKAERAIRFYNLDKSFEWLGCVILFIDEVSKLSTITNRREMMHMNTHRVWRWFDLFTGKWTPYSVYNNQIINDAYDNNEPQVRVSVGRRRYTIQFSNMLQVNDESGSNRPVTLTVLSLSHSSVLDVTKPVLLEPVIENQKPSTSSTPTNGDEETTSDNELFINLTKAERVSMIKSCTGLLSLPVDKKVLHSSLQILVRFTKDYKLAALFVKEGGINNILKIKYMPEFLGCGILSTILIKHALEEPQILAACFEKIIRSRTSPTMPQAYKELVYLTRQISGAVARSPETFTEVCKNILKCDITSIKNNELNLKLITKSDPPSTTKTVQAQHKTTYRVISALCSALRRRLTIEKTDATVTENNRTSACTQTNKASKGKEKESKEGENTERSNTNDQSESRSSKTPEETEGTKTESQSGTKYMLSKSVILKILSDAVVSYPPVGRILAEMYFTKEQCSVFTYIIDKIIMETPDYSDSECASMGRMLIASIASCNHSSEAQQALVIEVKQALTRGLLKPESAEKHTYIQNICGIISTMIENCPPPAKLVQLRQPHNLHLTHIVRLLVRKGVLVDLARASHYLDLSSPYVPHTANAFLKPLELLSRIINQPSTLNLPRIRREEVSTLNLDNTSNDDTNAQGDDIDDTENTDQDVSSTLDGGNNDNVLDHIMGQILEGSNANNSLNRARSIEIGGNFDNERDGTEEMMSTDSGDDDSNSEHAQSGDNLVVNAHEDDDEIIEDSENNFGVDPDDPLGVLREDDDDVLMIHYTNSEQDIPRIRWTENGFAVPVYDDANTTPADHATSIIHPLLLTRNSAEMITNTMAMRSQRANRARRYQYLYSPRSQNPPVMIQRLIGPQDPHIMGSNIIGGTQEVHEATRVVVMENFSYIDSDNVDIFDPTAYLFGPSSIAAAMHCVPPLMYWWNIEARVLDIESIYDITLIVSNELVPTIIKHRNKEMTEKRKAERNSESPSTSPPRAKIRLRPVRPNNIEDTGSDDSRDVTSGTNADRQSTSNTRRTRRLYRPEEYTLNEHDIALDDGMEIRSVITALQNFREITMPIFRDRETNTDENNDSSDDDDQQEEPSRDVTAERPPQPSSPQSIFGNSRNISLESQNNGERAYDPALPIFVRVESEPSGENTNSGTQTSEIASTSRAVENNTDNTNKASSEASSSQIQGEQSGNAPEPPSTMLETQLSNNIQNENRPFGSDIPIFVRVEPEPRPETANQTEEAQDGQIITPTMITASTPVILSDQPCSSSMTITSAIRPEDIPEGVDPSFLEAIPPEMRHEVLEQYRQSTRNQDNMEVPSDVSQEFLAALPPNLQEEVLVQQRMEAQQQANPNDPVDAAAFFETLQPSLRTMILADMDESQIQALPPDLAAEAQNLRRDLEMRNNQIMSNQDRFIQNNIDSILRHTRGRVEAGRGNIVQIRPRPGWRRYVINLNNPVGSSNTTVKFRGRQLLDQDSICCILVLLFLESPGLNKLRLHRVIRNLCYHPGTKDWIMNALLSVIERSVNAKLEETPPAPLKKSVKPGPLVSKLKTDSELIQNGSNWLNVRMGGALGCIPNVFIVKKSTAKKTQNMLGGRIEVHPQASSIVCKNVLDLFITLSKTFPNSLLTVRCHRDPDRDVLTPVRIKTDFNNIWDIFLRLDTAADKKSTLKNNEKQNKKNNFQSNAGTLMTPAEIRYFSDTSILSILLDMLASPVIYSNTHLTDTLLRFLAVITSSIPDIAKSIVKSRSKRDTVSPPVQSVSLAVDILTFKNCSEEGLEFATSLLLNLASASFDASYMILNLLLSSARKIGETVKEQIEDMLEEITAVNEQQKKKIEEREGEQSPKATNTTHLPSTSRGTMTNRFTKETVVITASPRVKVSYELQLPSMVPLTSKNSSQLFFLRVLRVIVNIRTSIKESLKLHGSSTTYTLPALSDQLNKLEDLWEVLSQCLLELEHNLDHHAVLVLQPAVEAFFLVHSPNHGERQRFRDFKGPDPPVWMDLREEEITPIANIATRSTEGETSNTAEPQTSAAPTESNNTEAPPAQESTSASPFRTSTPTAPRPTPTTESVPSTSTQEPYFVDGDTMGSEGRKTPIPQEHAKFLSFAEKHRTVLNSILRQCHSHLTDGPFFVLVDHTKVLDFDIKRRYFRIELERMDMNMRREETAVHVRRQTVFEDSFRELFRKTPDEWKNRFYIVFEDEEGQDAGGLLREWYMIISREIFNPMYALFTVSPGDRVTYMINPASHYNTNHLCYFKFVGRVIAKAIYDNKLLECYFTRSFYKHILGIPVRYTDMESEDYSFYRSLVYLMENDISMLGLDLTFSTEINEFGVTEVRDLIPNGRNVPVTEQNKMDYVRLSCQMKMTGAIKQQLQAFLEGFYDIIPKRLISIFNEQELELLISGLPNVDIEDLRNNTEYHKYLASSLQIQWFWRALRSFDQAERAKFLQFVTGTSKVPLQGFGALEGMNGVQKFQIHRDDRSTDRLPSAHTCFNQLDLPAYETYDKLRAYLLKAIDECSEGFGFA